MTDIKLQIAPERFTVRTSPGHRFVHFQVDVRRPDVLEERLPVAVALVIDRSGSMAGDNLEMAKRATVLVIEQLNERDRFSVVTFDDQVEVVQPLAIASKEVKARAIGCVMQVQSGSTTALFDGWAKGAEQIYADAPPAQDGRLNRVMILTDGRANAGLTDTGEITRHASLMREQHRVGTTAFGIGSDYNRELLLQMAQAGGGEFHHLRTGADIVATFAHELHELFEVAARGVRVEAEIESGARLEMITPGWTDSAAVGPRFAVVLGDLMAGETRHVVARAKFPAGSDGTFRVNVQVTSDEGGSVRRTFEFKRADRQTCDAEARDPNVMRWTALHRAERAVIKAVKMLEDGNPRGALTYLKDIRHWIQAHAASDSDVRNAIVDLRKKEDDIVNHRTNEEYYREATYFSARSSRGKGDARTSGSGY